MKYIFLVGRLLWLFPKIIGIFIAALFHKRAAIKQFSRELEEFDLPQAMVVRLTNDYKNMINFNPFAYIVGRWKNRRNHETVG